MCHQMVASLVSTSLSCRVLISRIAHLPWNNFDQLALADVFGDQLITYQEQPEGKLLLIQYNPMTNELTQRALPLSLWLGMYSRP